MLNNALNHGNAEEPECVKEEDGALDSMDAKDPHSQPKLQVSSQPTENNDQLETLTLFYLSILEKLSLLRDFFYLHTIIIFFISFLNNK